MGSVGLKGVVVSDVSVILYGEQGTSNPLGLNWKLEEVRPFLTEGDAVLLDSLAEGGASPSRGAEFLGQISRHTDGRDPSNFRIGNNW